MASQTKEFHPQESPDVKKDHKHRDSFPNEKEEITQKQIWH
jgi:hypothetical protein